MTSSLTEAYNGAVLLNNIGVALLERRCYAEAISTFNNAIIAMLNVSSQLKLQLNPYATSKDPVETYFSQIDDKAMLQQALGFLKNLEPSVCTLPGDKSPLALSLLSYELKGGMDGTNGIREFLTANPTILTEPSLTCAINMKSETCPPMTKTLNFIDVEAAALLHNLGTTHLHRALFSQPSHAKDEELAIAFRIFQFSYSVLMNNLIVFEDRSNTQRMDLFLLSIIMLLNLLRLAPVIGRRNDFLLYESLVVEASQAILDAVISVLNAAAA